MKHESIAQLVLKTVKGRFVYKCSVAASAKSVIFALLSPYLSTSHKLTCHVSIWPGGALQYFNRLSHTLICTHASCSHIGLLDSHPWYSVSQHLLNLHKPFCLFPVCCVFCTMSAFFKFRMLMSLWTYLSVASLYLFFFYLYIFLLLTF